MFKTNGSLWMILFILSIPLGATEPPVGHKNLPKAYYDRLAANPSAFKFKNGFLKLTANAQEGREKVREGASPIGILTEVRGHKKILVLLVKFSDSPTSRYAAPDLGKRLFGANLGTLSSYYRENSYGKLLVDGNVQEWKNLGHDSKYYAGKDSNGEPCYGVCPNSKVAELVEEALKANDDSHLWGSYDNDGPDDQSNTNDDDGFVDFVVVVHQGAGAECDNNNPSSLWSHQDLLSNWQGHNAFSTKTKSNSKNGGNIKVNDYVLIPAVACDGTTPIQIGVIAHEFGHSLGLPDLYDTNRNAQSEGLGNWDLMAGGSWGGDGQSPEMPVQMSPWSKSFLGWVKPIDVTADISVSSLKNYETEGDIYLVTIDKGSNIYYLISNRQKVGFDSKLPGEGLFILRVNEATLKVTLGQNTVNADPTNMGVAVVEADGLQKLMHHPPENPFRGGPGDTFPGESHKKVFDHSTTPQSEGTIAICEISDSSNAMKLRILVSQGVCPTGATAGQLSKIPLKALLAAPSKFVENSVRIEGVLTNEVSNYFGQQTRLIVRDPEGNTLRVSPWLPKEIPLGPHGQGPPVLSQFLGRPVELTGRLEAQRDPSNPGSFIFRVESARILP